MLIWYGVVLYGGFFLKLGSGKDGKMYLGRVWCFEYSGESRRDEVYVIDASGEHGDADIQLVQ